MADGYISAVQLPGNNTYDIKDKNAVTEIQIVGETQTKTNGVVNLPAYVTQSNSTSGHYRAIMLGCEEISNDTPYSTSTVTNKVYKTEKFQYNSSGGILKNSGHIYIKSDNLDRDGEAPTSDQTGKSLYFVDKDTNGVGRIYTVQRKTNNKKDLFLAVYNASGASNSIGIRILDDGTPSYYLSSSSAFRAALDNAAYIDANTITNNQVIIADGTDGKLKSSGWTIAADVPSGAVFTDENVLQENNTDSKYSPIALTGEKYNNLSSYSSTSITTKIYKTESAFLRASDGTFYGGAFVACNPISTGTSNTTSKRTYINSNGLYTDNYMANYSIAAYGRQVIQSYAGKCTSNNGLLLKIDSGGLTIVGGGESGANLAGLISNDQTIENPDRLDINNSAGASGKETTAFTGDSEHLILSSDGSIYFATGCNTIANRVAVCLNSSRIFYPMTDNTGSIGSNSYRWANGYFTNINGVTPVLTDTTYTFANGTNGFTVTPSGGTAQTVTVTPSIANNITGSGTNGKIAKFTGTNTIGNGYGVDTTVTSGSDNLITSGAVYTAIANLPEPMVFKGSLGTGGTITTLPIDGSAKVGDTYKVITDGTYSGQAAKIGDLFICDSKTSSVNTWTYIPSADEPSGTVTSITIKATSPIAIDSSSAITTSGTRTISHVDSGVSAGTYKSVTVNATGHVTSGTNPTTLSGYGITDAKISNGTITLGSNTITPLTSHQAETSIRSYLTSTVGHACKNQLDLSKYTYSSGISNVVIDAATGSLSFTGTGTNRAVNFIAANLGVEMYGKTYTVSCVNNLASTTTGRLTIRRRTTNDIVKRVSFSTTGNKSITFTPDEETFPNGWYISVIATGSTSTTGSIDISNLMLREASISDDTFEPYVTPTDEKKQDKPVELDITTEWTIAEWMDLLNKYNYLQIITYTDVSFDVVIVPLSIFSNTTQEIRTVSYASHVNNDSVALVLFVSNGQKMTMELGTNVNIYKIIGIPK